MYAIDFGAGIVWTGYKSLQAAKRAATEGLTLSSRNVLILDEEGNCIAIRRWHDRYERLTPTRGCVKFGDQGFYGCWE